MQTPFLQAMPVDNFFDGTLEVERMAGKVDGALYREKVNKEIIFPCPSKN